MEGFRLIIGGSHTGSWDSLSTRTMPDAAATAMEVGGLSFSDFLDKADLAKERYDDLEFFMWCIDFLSAGIPYYLFEFLGKPTDYIKPDQMWCLIDLNWEKQIPVIEAYRQKLIAAGL